MTLQTLLLLGSAFIAGLMNSVAGGGSFVSFPALLFVGFDAKLANATNAVALWPGSLASVGAYRRELRAQQASLKLLSAVSLVGGLLGALLLLITPSTVFKQLLPLLMLAATLIFAFSPWINQLARRNRPPFDPAAPPSRGVLVI